MTTFCTCAHQRFVKKLGAISDELLKIVHSTVAKTLNPAYVLKFTYS